jgi:CubicO group peptidase (beta-lactamase class C family)
MTARTARNIMIGVGFSLMVLLVLSACQRPANTGAQSVETSPAVLYRVLAVEEQLLPAWVIAGVDRDTSSWTIEGRMTARAVPGVSVAVINADRIEWARGYGEAAAGEAPVDADTIFQAASIGKTLTAMTVLALVDRGVLDLDRDVNEYLVSWRLPTTEIADGEIVTLDRILSHTAGLTVHGFGGYTPGEELPSLRQMLDGEAPTNSGAVRIAWKPGTEMRYSGGGYLVSQQIIEDVTGKPFESVVEELVLRPLGMTRTFYRATLDTELARSASAGHLVNGAIMPGRYRAMPEYGAGAGLWSTPSDLCRLALAIADARTGHAGGPVSPAAARDMLTPRLGGNGLGVFLSGQGDVFAFYHGGDNTGFHAFLVVYPERGQGAAIMTNGDGGILLYSEILRAISAVYEWPDYRPVRATVAGVDQGQLERLSGIWSVEGFGELPVSEANGALELPDLWGTGAPIRLFPVNRRTFVAPDYDLAFAFEDPDTGVPGVAEITFGLDTYRASRVDTPKVE